MQTAYLIYGWRVDIEDELLEYVKNNYPENDVYDLDDWIYTHRSLEEDQYGFVGVLIQTAEPYDEIVVDDTQYIIEEKKDKYREFLKYMEDYLEESPNLWMFVTCY